MANRTPSFNGLGLGSGFKSGLTEKDRDKVTQQNPPKASPSTRGYA